MIGTHSRDVEGRLLDNFSTAGWELEAEHACTAVVVGTRVCYPNDCLQVWRNDRV